jgi:hypothetical protein
MRKETKILIAVLSMFAMAGCHKKMVSPSDYVKYISAENNGLKKTVIVSGWEYSLQYRPSEFIVLSESQGQWTKKNMQARMNQLSGVAWFSITIKRVDNSISPLKYGVSSNEEYERRLDYFLNKAKTNIWVTYGSDTLVPVSYLFENNFNLTPQETMLAGFLLPNKDKAPDRDLQLSYLDNEIQQRKF